MVTKNTKRANAFRDSVKDSEMVGLQVSDRFYAAARLIESKGQDVILEVRVHRKLIYPLDLNRIINEDSITRTS